MWLLGACLMMGVSGLLAQRVQKDVNHERVGKDCSACDLTSCESPVECLAGVVMDSCGCCQVCAMTEGKLCNSGYNSKEEYGQCGDNLECLHTGSGESVCVCREIKMVCGSDGVTYSTPCKLNEESVSRSTIDKVAELNMEYWGPCKEAPTILSPPSDTYGASGENLTLSCEARGHPAPTVTWQYENVEGDTISLPSDDAMISIQMRGGPEPLMVTGWAQILSLDPTYSGVYHCIASNSEGKVHAKAAVGVYRQR